LLRRHKLADCKCSVTVAEEDLTTA
jgi:hypothetical protein